MRDKPLLRGKYKILERIGAGSMAAVFAGSHAGTDRPVAIKRLLPDRVTDPNVIARFEREARAAGRVRSSHVVEILDFDHDDEGAPFIVLERLVGESLFERARREPRMPVALAIALARQVLSGLADLHRAGVVHRDLKPANVFLVEREGGVPLVKLVDFGVAKLETTDRALTRADETIGTLAFMPPEQIDKSTTAGPAADLWAAGVVLFRMLTGTSPFSAEDPVSLVARILHHPAPRLAELGVDATAAAALQPVLDRALEKDPARRHSSADAMREQLDEAARALGIDPGARAPLSVPPAPMSQPPAAATTQHGFDAPTREWSAALESPPGPSQPPPADVGPPLEPAHPAAMPRARASPARVALAIAAVAALGGGAGWAAAGTLGPATPSAHVAVVTTPPDATIWIGDAPIADRTRVPIPHGGGRVRVAAPGHRETEVELPQRGGTSLVVKLAAAPSAEIAAAPTAEPPVEPSPEPPAEDIEIEEPVAPRGAAGRARPRPRTTRPTPSATAAPAGPARPPVIPVAPY